MNNKNLQTIKKIFAFSHDAVASIIAWFCAYQLRFNFEMPPDQLISFFKSFPFVVVIQVSSFYFFGLYRGVWRFASLIDLKRIIFSVCISLLFFNAVFFMLKPDFLIPRSVLIIDLLLIILMMGGSRFIYRAIKEHHIYMPFRFKGEPVVIIGSNQSAIALSKELSLTSKWHVVGLVDNDKSLHGREISGFKILGNIDDLSKIQSRLGFSKAIFADHSLSAENRRSIFRHFKELDIQIFTSPAADDLVSGRFSISEIRPIEMEDLLGRDIINLDTSKMLDLITNQPVLISGAGGSIGSELCRQIIKFKPSALICYDISESSLYQLEQELHTLIPDTSLICLVGDVKNEKRLHSILSNFKPTLVFHAAAYKHVPLMEENNVAEAFNNNVLGTYILAKACQKANVSRFVLISTDKAVNPTNVMGASKRMAEMICQGLQKEKGTKFLTVRFGNVLGSSGSVIPKFREQIKLGGPLTVTHPDVTRYFMSIPEAAQLVMQASAIGTGGEIFILDMGEPIKIVDLARDMIRLSGFMDDEIKIEFVGLRPGEKLNEELLADDEKTIPTEFNKLRIAKARNFDSGLLPHLLRWIDSIQDLDELNIKKEIRQWINEYSQELNISSSKTRAKKL